MTYKVLSQYRAELMGIALLRVMLTHSTGINLGSEALNNLCTLGGGVDIFIILSAIGLVASLSYHPMDDAAFMRRRAKRVLPAFYVVMLPYTVYLILHKGAPWSALIWNSSLLYYWVQSGGSFNWYISVIMLFYAAAPFCYRLLKKSRHRALLTAVGFLLGIALCQLMIHERYMQYADAYCRIPVFFLGLLLGFYVFEEKKFTWKDAVCWLLFLLAGIAYQQFRIRADTSGIPFFFTPYHVNLLIMVPLCLIACILFRYLPLGWLRKPLRLLGENSLEIYLLNVSLFAAPLDIRTWFTVGGPSLRLFYLILWVVNIVLGILLHKLLTNLTAKLKAHRGEAAAV